MIEKQVYEEAKKFAEIVEKLAKNHKNIEGMQLAYADRITNGMKESHDKQVARAETVEAFANNVLSEAEKLSKPYES